MYELIVFDWDGTLMDSEGKIVACLQTAAADLGFEVPEVAAARDVIGLGLHQAVAQLFPQVSDTDVERLANRYRYHFLGDQMAPSELFAGAGELLEGLVDKGYFLAVATGKSRRGLEKELDSSGLRGLFHVTRCADETFSKPNPQMLLEILAYIGMDAKQALVVGDTEYDMLMASNAACDAIGVSHGVHDAHRLRSQGALTVLDELLHIPRWLESAAVRAGSA